jgi:hypothetical protein
VIGVPFDNNDLTCLGSISEVVAELVDNRDLLLAELAALHPTTDSLAAWIRSLPQRNDEGDPTDGPKVATCEPVQRLRIPAPDPNCVERAALYLGVAELIDPRPLRQLATLDFEWGRHTFPIESGAPIILDPSVPADDILHAVAAGALAPRVLSSEPPLPVAPSEPVTSQSPHGGPRNALVPVALDVNEAIEYTAHLAETGARATRNGPNRARLARNALHSLIQSGTLPSDERTVDAVAWFFAQAESVARSYGARALNIVRTSAQAVSNLIDDILAQQHPRNLSFGIGGTNYEIPSWLTDAGKVAGKIGLGVGALYYAPQLAALGITGPMVKLVEEELNAEGLSLGALAKPESSLATALGSAMTSKNASGRTGP